MLKLLLPFPSVDFLTYQLFISVCDYFPAWLHFVAILHTFCFFTVGSWLIPGTGTLCPPANPHPQFGAPLSLSPAHSCERYSSLRNHRPAPYPSPYTHRNNSPSKSDSVKSSLKRRGMSRGMWVLSGVCLEWCHRNCGCYLAQLAQRAWSQLCKEIGMMSMCPESLYDGKTEGV